MVVAEKFQTGFDQPKLVAMYVDKTLTGLAAVQTLSRLNRTHPDKDGTFVLDFVNDSENIQDAFAVYHGKTVAPPTDPNLLFDTRDELNDYSILDPGEMQQAAGLMLGDGTHEQIHAAIQPAVERFNSLDLDDQDMFRDALTRFVRVYGFLAQVVKFTNVGLERDYIYCRALAALIRDKNPGNSIDLGSEVELTHLRHDKIFEGSHLLFPDGEGEVQTIYSGTGPLADPDEEHLSAIISRINERFGTDWTEEDRLVFEAAAGDLVHNDEIQNQAINNDEPTFRDHVFADQFQKALMSRLDRNDKVVFAYLDNKEMQTAVATVYAAKVQKQAIVANQQTCPIGDLLGTDRESLYLEYKIHPLLGHQTTAKVQNHRERRRQNHRRIRQLPLWRHPPHRRSRQRLPLWPRRRLQHLLQTRSDRRPRPLGPTPPKPHPPPPRRLRPLPSHLGLPQNQQQRPNPYQHQPLRPSHLRHHRQNPNLLAPHPRKHPRHNRPQRKSPHHRHPLGRKELTRIHRSPPGLFLLLKQRRTGTTGTAKQSPSRNTAKTAP